jgi:hypothetical protein
VWQVARHRCFRCGGCNGGLVELDATGRAVWGDLSGAAGKEGRGRAGCFRAGESYLAWAYNPLDSVAGFDRPSALLGRR